MKKFKKFKKIMFSSFWWFFDSFCVDFSGFSPIILGPRILASGATLAEKYTYLRAQTELEGVLALKSYQNKPCGSIEQVVGAQGAVVHALPRMPESGSRHHFYEGWWPLWFPPCWRPDYRRNMTNKWKITNFRKKLECSMKILDWTFWIHIF